MGPDPKRTAAAVLSLSPPGDEDGGGDESGEFDTESAALEAAASEAMAAFEAKDTTGFARALRAAFQSMKG